MVSPHTLPTLSPHRAACGPCLKLRGRLVCWVRPADSTLYSEQCTSHGEPDIYNIALNGYMRFVDQCQMLSKRCPHGIFETIWAAVNATDMVTQAEDRFNSKATLNRQEWLQVLVRCAIAVHIQQGRMGDVSDAVSQLMTSNLVRNLPAAALQNSNAFRKRFCCACTPSTHACAALQLMSRSMYGLNKISANR